MKAWLKVPSRIYIMCPERLFYQPVTSSIGQFLHSFLALEDGRPSGLLWLNYAKHNQLSTDFLVILLKDNLSTFFHLFGVTIFFLQFSQGAKNQLVGLGPALKTPVGVSLQPAPNVSVSKSLDPMTMHQLQQGSLSATSQGKTQLKVFTSRLSKYSSPYQS